MLRTSNWVSSKLPKQPGEYTRKNDKDRYETSEDNLLGLGELLLFSVRVAAMADVGDGGGCGGKNGCGIKSPNRTQGDGSSEEVKFSI